jgi:hypothetical protein
MKVAWMAAAASALALTTATAADASVLYEFSNNAIGLGFTLTTDDFITSLTAFPASELDSCNPLPPFASPCSSVTFSPDLLSHDHLEITFDLGGGSFAGNGYSFVLGSFQTEGLHVDGAGMLTVSHIDSAVPEPSTWAMMLVGFAVVGVAMRRRKSNWELPQAG